ncbi:MAG: 16S rRNA (cytidine(1402)-2'-O)-methyltransferase [Clostridia bacterium]|nr:16S rRNA (cytidine(1402)-2'-O)-methyltransferase [Clostridia bacterium]
MPGALYLVATPIGNLGDLSSRAAAILSGVDFVAAEDTRVTAKLLSHLGVSKPMMTYHRHNLTEAGEKLQKRLQSGESCALVTDAGTPGISDPGEDAARLCAENGIKVVSVPGACAAVSALSVSALPTKRFCFEGFLSSERSKRLASLRALAGETRTIVFYEAPHRLAKTLSDMKEVFGGDRKISLCRELTKLNEEVIRTDLEEAAARFEKEEPRGEFVLVVSGAPEAEDSWEDTDIPGHFEFYLSRGLSQSDAMKAVAKDRHVAKSEIYRALKIKEQ